MGAFDQFDGFATRDISETSSSNPFTNASTYTKNAQSFVTGQITTLNTLLTSSLSKFQTSIDGLKGWVPPTWSDIEIKDPVLDFTTPADWGDIDYPVEKDFGTISPPDIGNVPQASGIDSISTPRIPTFSPSYTSLSIPPAPNPKNIPDPGNAPDTPLFSYPPAPEIDLPRAPELTQISVPDFSGLTLPTFDPTYPEFRESNINTVLQWSEPEYTEEILGEVLAQIRTFLAGGTGVDPDVEDALVARAREREDKLTEQNVQQALDEWANRGYTAPPGLLVKRIDELRESGLIKKLGLAREVLIKTHQDELDNLRFAVQQGLQAERFYLEIFQAATQRLFEIQRLSIQWQVELYNISVQVFNAKMQQVQIQAQIYETQVRAALAELEVFKALVDAEMAKAEINKSLVESYKAEIESREALVSIYEAQVRAVAVEAEVYQTQINAYRGEIEAYATRVDADKTRFEAYESQVRGELAKANITESEARAYQATIEGIRVGVQADVEAVRAQVAKFEAEVSAFDAKVRGVLGKSQAEAANVDARIRSYAADVERYRAQAGLEEGKQRVSVAEWDAGQRQAIAAYQANIAEFSANADAMLKEGELLMEALKSAGQLESTIAAGTLAAVHVGATMSGGASVSASGSDAVSTGFSRSCANSVSYSGSAVVSDIPNLSNC